MGTDSDCWAEVDRRRAEMERVKREYTTLFFAVRDVLSRRDPVGIVFDDINPDEYEPEVRTIIPRLKEANCVDYVRRIVFEEFVKWFDQATAEPEARYQEIAREIWDAWQRFPM